MNVYRWVHSCLSEVDELRGSGCLALSISVGVLALIWSAYRPEASCFVRVA